MVNGSNKCIYIPGGGDTAVWFNFGQLQVLNLNSNTNNDKDVYCGSAVCGASLIALAGMTVDDILELKVQMLELNPQDNTRTALYQKYEIDIDTIVNSLSRKQLKQVLPRLNVMRMTANIGMNVRKTRNKTHLRSLLRQTSWVPFVTANDWFTEDEDDKHFDADILAQLFPPCHQTLTTPFWKHYGLIQYMLLSTENLNDPINLYHAGVKYVNETANV